MKIEINMKKIIVTLLSLYITNNLVNAQIKMEDFDDSGKTGYIIRSFLVKETSGGGARCVLNTGDDVFIQNLNNAYSDRTYGEIHVWYAGNYEYGTIIGSQRRIPRFIAFSESDESKYKEYQLEKNKRINEMLAEQRKQKQESDSIKKTEMTVRALQNRKEQATNGLPTFQYQLGVSYITGADGETNKSLGRYWLIRSAAQGNEDAEKYLKELK